MAVSLIPAVSAGNAAHAADARKVVAAARDFEALLLGSLLQSLQQTFVGTAHQGAGASAFDHLATNALASALAHSGGIGIAQLIASKLLKQEAINNGSPLKNLPPRADKT